MSYRRHFFGLKGASYSGTIWNFIRGDSRTRYICLKSQRCILLQQKCAHFWNETFQSRAIQLFDLKDERILNFTDLLMPNIDLLITQRMMTVYLDISYRTVQDTSLSNVLNLEVKATTQASNFLTTDFLWVVNRLSSWIQCDLLGAVFPSLPLLLLTGFHTIINR